MVVAVDYDDTLVSYPDGEWLPGAREVLKSWRRNGHTVIVHSARCNFDGGRQQIEAKLVAAGFRFGPRLRLEAKPLADVYIDDRAVRFEGDWTAVRNQLGSKRA